MSDQHSFLIVSCFRNAEQFIAQSAMRSLQQQYDSYRIIFVDDASDDDSLKILNRVIQEETSTRCQDVLVESHRVQRGALKNTHEAILRHALPNDIIVIVDGDDRLIHADVLTYVNAFYQKHDCWVMYGGAHWSPAGSQLFYSSSYSNDELKNLRIHPKVPHELLVKKWKVHHIRTFRAELYLELERRDPNWSYYRDHDGDFFSLAADAAVMRPIMELAGGARVKHNHVKLYDYQLHPQNDLVIDCHRQWECVRRIFAKPSVTSVQTLPQPRESPAQLKIQKRSLPPNAPRISHDRTDQLVLTQDQNDRKRLDSPLVLKSFPQRSLEFSNDSQVRTFSCQVTLNHRDCYKNSSASFLIYADNELVGYAPEVRTNQDPRTLTVSVPANATLRFLVEGDHRGARWINPIVSGSKTPATIRDPLGRSEFQVPSNIPVVNNCIATVATPSHQHYLSALLESIAENNDLSETLICIYAIEDNGIIQEIANRYSAKVISSNLYYPVDATTKALLYSIASVVRAKRYICLDADMIVYRSLQPIFNAIDTLPKGSTLVVRESNSDRYADLRHAMTDVYQGSYPDFEKLCFSSPHEDNSKLVVNDGFFAGDRKAMLMLDSAIRDQTALQNWVFERSDVVWRNQFAFNLSLAHFDNGVNLSDVFNFQLEYHRHLDPIQLVEQGWKEEAIAILHYNGNARPFHPSFQISKESLGTSS